MLSKGVLKGIQINKLRDGIMMWKHRVKLFGHYMRFKKEDLVNRIDELKDYREEDEWTLGECIMYKTYFIKPK
jgi:hypothetical protein